MPALSDFARRKKIDFFLAPIHKQAAILEVGCGAGWMWAESSTPVPFGVELTLSDLSPGMVDAAVERVETKARIGIRGHPLAERRKQIARSEKELGGRSEAPRATIGSKRGLT